MTATSLVDLFCIKKKSELKKAAQSFELQQSDLVNAILACECDLLPWQHRISYRDFQPAHLHLKEDDLDALSNNGIGPLQGGAVTAMNKMSAMLKERRYLVGHMFFTPSLTDWHFIYFDQRDVSAKANHWDGRSHVHLINHLWPQHGAQTLWERFNSGNIQMSGALYLRYTRTSDVRKKRGEHERRQVE